MKRYKQDYRGDFCEDPYGGWVKYDHVAVLDGQFGAANLIINRQDNKMDRMNELLNEWERRNTNLEQENATLLRRLETNIDWALAEVRAVKLSHEVGVLRRKLAQYQDERECECNLRTKLVGDGCDTCNPSYAEGQWEDEGGAI